MPRAKHNNTTRKNLFISKAMNQDLQRIAHEYDVSEAEIIRGALHTWLSEFRRISPRLQHSRIAEAMMVSKELTVVAPQEAESSA